MAFTPDLPLYFERIGYRGSRAPTLATLNAIMFAHVRTIPFENLDVLLGRAIDLDPAALEHKLLRERRGGYCFEQNTLLLHVLEALGYSVRPLSARVRGVRPPADTRPRTHVFSCVELDGSSWLVDVGAGSLTPTCPLRLVLDITQETSHEPRRIVARGRWQGLELRSPDARLVHQVYFDQKWHDVCEFTLEEMPPIDRELANWFTSTHPKSQFKERLMVALVTLEGRKTLLNREFTLRDLVDGASISQIETPDELLALLAREFGLVIPAGAHLACPGLDFGDT